MKCPYCGQEMEQGYIQCRDGVTWTAKRKPIAALPLGGKDWVSLANGAAEHSRIVFAYRCRDCKKVLIEYLEN